ncbi:hypothetical protein [Chitinophaga defluvii]|uniref:DUF3945 domain-containing protein n=1 Tax=Chitinophaga defluvii TaxID=3163343 RepID=A0ABV2TCF3_9BACT
MEKDIAKITVIPPKSLDTFAAARYDGKTISGAHPQVVRSTGHALPEGKSGELQPETKILSVYKMERTFFHVDIDNRRFIKVGVPDHTISFDHMVYKGSHYEMPFDLFLEKPPKPGDLNHEDVVITKIPQLVTIALQEMSEKYQVPAYELKNLSDFDLMVDLKALAAREKDLLPVFEIFGKNYNVDLEDYSFKRGDHKIPLNGFKPVSDPYGDRYAYIDSGTHQLVKIDITTIKEMPPERVVKIVIPSNDRLDAYYVGKNREPDLKTYLLSNPILTGQKARVIPLSQTNIPAIVKSNVNNELRQQFEQTQRLNARKMRRGINT